MPLAFNILQQRVESLNQWRIAKALAAGTAAFQQIYPVLPLLLHYHHPRLPGYESAEVPRGICLFHATAHQQRLLTAIAPGIPRERLKGPPAIAAIYSMGSTASIGQTHASDLDLWICLQPDLPHPARNALQRKCQLLRCWGQQQGIELSFFMIDGDHWLDPTKIELRSRETSIHPLILDEFYRTQVRLAGKRLLWPVIPAKQEDNYQQCCTALYRQGVIDPEHWIDFGNLPNRLPTDCILTVPQQLCSNHPVLNKMVLKNLLLESYTAKSPKVPWCALVCKQRLQQAAWRELELDPYCQLLNHISHYLAQQGAYKRLSRIRRCFYRKICDHPSHPPTGWRQSLIHRLLQQWGWDQTLLQRVDPRLGKAFCKQQAIHPDELLREIKLNQDNLHRAGFRGSLWKN